ncbi:uncharacterized protein PGTG_07707 [Puccinia graminis f. sp. tritici CRL 75-36-700-3]|uniref:acetylornithine transaminase n=3 Tax=Puccinia graminis f. sp. tritici TaxID=56615 RepID=E3KD96_PUCGT|nr:uncharacterized protein PGTG_07707 [Puccinia graminis f. sp. tritici CRL 75-36-700-3]EFP82310.2 hypothetical protein PGTG_07707 [Puccinia graminis f. sp. tritici CRL 75-36-700-3]
MNTSRKITNPRLTRQLKQSYKLLHPTSIRFISHLTHPDHPVPQNVQHRIERWSKSMLTPYARPPMILSHGKGCKVWDTEGREYLDFTAGIAVNALGHADKEVAEIMYQQAQKLVHCSNLYHNDQAGELACTLVNLTKKFGGLGYPPLADSSSVSAHQESPQDHKVFFANSGAEANEGALKFARKCGKIEEPTGSKHELICFTNGFHGRTFGALSVTNQPKYQLPFAPLLPGIKPGNLNDISALTELITPNTCGVIVEPIQGEGGILEASEEFLRALRHRCDEVKAVLIYDEIQCGLGRTGNLWAHGSLPTDCHPDMLTMAKPLANGVPIGAVMMRDNVAKKIAIGDHGTTFGGAPLQTAIAKHVLERICKESFMDQVRGTSEVLKKELNRLVAEYPNILTGPVRGRGLIMGLEVKNLQSEDHAKQSEPTISQIINLSRQNGLLLLSCGQSIIRFVPSLIISHSEVSQMILILEKVLAHLSSPKV